MKKIIFNQDTFKEFFSPVGPFHSHHNKNIWPYDYVDRNSDTLLVTVGDSWTWGSGICDVYNDALTITKEQNNFRLDNLYGNLISKEKNWNWLNLGFYGVGNQWTADKVFELRRLVPYLQFKNIILICVLTSVARWFNTWQDGFVDYKKHFEKNQMNKPQDYENFFIGINRKVIGQISHLINSENRIKLLVGTNQVDHCGFDVLRQEQIIPLPWYQLLSKIKLDNIYVDMEALKYLPSLENFLVDSDQKFAFQKWMIEKIDQAEKVNKLIANMNHVSFDSFHPNSKGHKIWAEYILEKII